MHVPRIDLRTRARARPAAGAALLLVAACRGAEPAPEAVAEVAAPVEAAAARPAPELDRPGFVTELEGGRLWVFAADQEPRRGPDHVTYVGQGPGGRTLMAADRATALAYLTTVPGFEAWIDDGRVHAVRAGRPRELGREPATWVGRGPLGTTVRAPDQETLEAYVQALDG